MRTTPGRRGLFLRNLIRRSRCSLPGRPSVKKSFDMLETENRKGKKENQNQNCVGKSCRALFIAGFCRRLSFSRSLLLTQAPISSHVLYSFQGPCKLRVRRGTLVAIFNKNIRFYALVIYQGPLGGEKPRRGYLHSRFPRKFYYGLN